MFYLFHHGADQTVSECRRGPWHYWNNHLHHLDIHLGLDECHQSEHQEHHDDLDSVDCGSNCNQLDLRLVLRNHYDANKHPLKLLTFTSRCARAGRSSSGRSVGVLA
jgi:hypothetical protein